VQYLERAAKQDNSPTLLLYLGHAYLATADRSHALETYQRLVTQYPNTPEARLAITGIARINPSAAQQYSKRTASSSTSITRRWTPASMPLKVYISKGLELPASMAGRILSQEEFRALSKSFKNPQFMRSLRVNALYTPLDKLIVEDALNMWNLVTSALQCTETENAADADILVFYCNTLTTSTEGKAACLYPYESGEPNIIQVGMSERVKYNQGTWATTRLAIVGHEFGHAFGLEHSSDINDLMFYTEDFLLDESGNVVGPPRLVTEADKTALRAHYSQPAKFWMVPVRSVK
jgi:hypothetical protein